MNETHIQSDKVNHEFQVGDVIQDYCDPFVKILLTSQKGLRCDNCFSTDSSTSSSSSPPLSRCTNCRLMFYCSKKCQVKDWKTAHKFECRSAFFRTTDPPSLFSSKANDLIQFKRRLLRLWSLLKLHSELALAKFPTYNGSARCFNDLLSHEGTLAQDAQVTSLCLEIVTQLRAEPESESGQDLTSTLTLDYFIRLAGIFQTNAFCIYNDLKTERIGSGLFLQTSVFDHSCKPTALFVMNGIRMQIRAVGAIPRGQQPTVSYILAHNGHVARRGILRRRYNFSCECERCKVEKVGGDAVDYDVLNELLTAQSSGSRTTTGNAEPEPEVGSGFKKRQNPEAKDECKNLLQIHEKIVGDFRKIYHEYDERITNQFHWLCSQLMAMPSRNCKQVVPRKVLGEILNEAKAHILITYGREHPNYIQFCKFCSELRCKNLGKQ